METDGGASTLTQVLEATARRVVRTPVGALWVSATERGLREALWRRRRRDVGETVQGGPIAESHLDDFEEQLALYFGRDLRDFDIPLDLVGTPFQRSVWSVLAEVPYGQRATYAEQADRIGRPRASRAVGAANGKNPVAIIVPCHRVIGADGSLTGYAGGLAAKRHLLDLERGQRAFF